MNNLICEVIHGGSFGLIVTVLLGIESSAAFVMAPVISFTFWSIFVCASIFLIIFESVRSCWYLSYQNRLLYAAIQGRRNFTSSMVGQ